MELKQLAEAARERAGDVLGALAAPAVALVAQVRRARMFHPEGVTFVGRSVAVDGPMRELGEDLAGRVLVRASAALWRGDFEHLDVLGLALRFRKSTAELDARARPGDQDLLTATIRSPLTMLASPFFTDASDFVGNTYWAVSPFEHEVGRVELRLVPVDPVRFPGRRVARLYQAVQAGRASWWLEARRTLRLRWHPVARIDLEREVAIDQDALFFDPFRGTLRPVGLVHAIRHATYAASQRTRAIISGEAVT
jgi:hypothetical protein